MSDYQILLNVDNENLKCKGYNPLALGAFNLMGNWDIDTHTKFMSVKEFRAILRKECHISKNKVTQALQVFLDLGFIKREEDCLYLTKVSGIFVKLYADTVRFCLEHLSILDFKIYCYLLNKWNLNQTYHFHENYFFTCKELAEKMGYFYNANMARTIQESLILLQKIGLINCDLAGRGKPGHHGTYMELYCAFNKSSVQELTAKALSNIEQMQEPTAPLPQAPPPWSDSPTTKTPVKLWHLD